MHAPAHATATARAARLGLRTLVALTPGKTGAALEAFAGSEGLALVHEAMDPIKSAEVVYVDCSVFARVLSLLVDAARYPTYFFCMDGQNVSGLSLLLLRRLQGWPLAPSVAEFRRVNPLVRVPPGIVAYVDSFWCSLRLPEVVPGWLWPALLPRPGDRLAGGGGHGLAEPLRGPQSLLLLLQLYSQRHGGAGSGSGSRGRSRGASRGRSGAVAGTGTGEQGAGGGHGTAGADAPARPGGGALAAGGDEDGDGDSDGGGVGGAEGDEVAAAVALQVLQLPGFGLQLPVALAGPGALSRRTPSPSSAAGPSGPPAAA